MTAFESQEDTLLMALNVEDRARSNGCRWCLEVSGDKDKAFSPGVVRRDTVLLTHFRLQTFRTIKETSLIYQGD